MKKSLVAAGIFLLSIADVFAQSCPVISPERQKCLDDCYDVYEADIATCQKYYPAGSSIIVLCYQSMADKLGECHRNCV